MARRRWDLPLHSIGRTERLLVTLTEEGSSVAKPTADEIRFYAALLGLQHSFAKKASIERTEPGSKTSNRAQAGLDLDGV